MLGYCATGKETTARAPTIIKTMAITHAKIGRSMKKFDTSGYCFRGGVESAVREDGESAGLFLSSSSDTSLGLTSDTPAPTL